MSKKIEPSHLSKETLKEMKGFEDVFEDYTQSEEFKELERKKNENFKFGEQYELLQFLEQENERLTSMDIFLTKKIPLKINFSQTEKLVTIQEEKKKILTLKIGSELKKMTSHFQKNMIILIDSHFS